MKELKIHVANPTTKIDYGNWDLKELITALNQGPEYKDIAVSMSLLYDLNHDELEFEIIQSQEK